MKPYLVIFLTYFLQLIICTPDITFKRQIKSLKTVKKLDIVFLVDGSSSVGVTNFESELNFVKKLLSDFTVSENRTKVSVVVFGSHAVVYEHSDKCELLNTVLPSINYPGSNTNTLGAFLAARELLHSGRKDAYKAIFLVTDGFSNGGDPIPIAKEIKREFNVTIFTIGIQNGNRKELQEITSWENTSYLLASFDEFDLLARKALHTDLKDGDYIRLEDLKCGGCDPQAVCTCGTSSGQYACKCKPGYFGTGKKEDCHPCPVGTWHDKLSGICMPCPDFNHETNKSNPAISIKECVCKMGYKKSTKELYKCEVMRCSKLKPPENGYFVGKTNCPNVLNSACGVRCKVGFSLRGTSIRICRESGEWDGLEAQCHIKTCPRPPIPVGGEVYCNNTDQDTNLSTLPDEMPVDTECRFQCEAGSNLIGSTKRTCLPIEQWDGLKTTCKPVRCIRLSKLLHGKASPQECTREKQKHGTKCNITCNKGYSGPGEIECVTKGRYGAWSSKPRCVDIEPPKLKCPDNIKTVALPGQNYGEVQWIEPTVTDNSNGNINIWWEPFLEEENKNGPYKFEIGETTVSYYAVDSSGNGAKCNFTILVLDEEPPKFENCIDPPPYLVGKEGITIEWDEPNVTDNSGNDLSILKSIDFGPLPIGVTPVEYTVIDQFNNTNVCILNITVQLSTCENEIPMNLDNCNNVPGGMLCVLTCEEGYSFAISDKATCESQNINWILPECTPTEIPSEISGETENNCQELKEYCNGDECNVEECEEDNRIKRQIKKRKRQIDNQKKRTKFRMRINKNINEERFKGIINENYKPTCRNGSVPHRTKIFRCVRCPRGFFHNISFKTCEPCPINTYNDKIGSTKCERCPSGTFTRGRKGSKQIRACKIRLGNKFRSLTRREPCKNDTCTNGKCVSVGTRYRCACAEGWVGTRCKIRRIDHCATEPCLNGGICTSQVNGTLGYSCKCPIGFIGTSCEIEDIVDDPPLPKINICKQVYNLCENGGICHPDKKSRGSYKCLCPPGFLGRRCQNVPCDYRPCPENNVCINILEDEKDTTRNSYRCDCPEGKAKPPECLEDVTIIDPCGGCQNDGICQGEVCECTKKYTGKLCEDRVSGDYILHFQTSGITDFAVLDAPQSILSEFTFCAWLETNNTFNYGTILSYATTEMDNALTLIDYTGLVLWINGKYVVTNVKINDGIWHHVCISWKSSTGDFLIVIDTTVKASGTGLSVGKSIPGGGTFVLGQDQDFPRGGFSRSESFVGKMAHVDIWDKKLEENEMNHDCKTYNGGNFVSWAEFRKGVRGNTKIMKSNFCRGCTPPNDTVSGGKWQITEDGSSVTLSCQLGYIIHIEGHPRPITSLTRQCLASGRWQNEATPPTCAKVHCAPPPYIRHARLTSRRRLWRYGDVARYHCTGGLTGVGQTWKTCGVGGRWSNETFECVGNHCQAFDPPKDANLTIISEHVYDEDFSEIKNFDIGTVVEITCLNKTVLITCLENQTWEGQIPDCSTKITQGKENKIEENKINRMSEDKLHDIEEELKKNKTFTNENTFDPQKNIANTTDNLIDITTKINQFIQDLNITSEEINKTIPILEANFTKPVDIYVTTPKTDITSQREESTTLPRNTSSSEEKDSIISSTELPESIGKYVNTSNQIGMNISTVIAQVKLNETEKELKIIEEETSKIQDVEDNQKIDKNIMIKIDLEDVVTKELQTDKDVLKNKTVGFVPVVEKVVDSLKTNLSKIDENIIESQSEYDHDTTSTPSTISATSPVLVVLEETTTPMEPAKNSQGCEGLYAPSIPDNGYLTNPEFDNVTVYEPGTNISYKCRSGYDLVGGTFSTCLVNGSWSNPEVSCQPVKCPQPPKYSNMYPKKPPGVNDFHFGNMISYECELGFSFYGNNIVRCQANGRWSRVKGKCARISCGKPTLTSGDETIIGSSYLYKDSLHIMCPTGSARVHYEAKCTYSGQWLYIGNCHTPESPQSKLES